MADTKITALTALTAADPANDVLPIVDVSDTTMAASGTTKKISVNNILGASGTATLASATITGDLTVDTSTLKVDSANNRVGIGTATPGNLLSVRNEAASGISYLDVRGGVGGAGVVQISGNGTTLSTTSFDLGQNSGGAFIYQRDALPLSILVNGSERYAISSTGVATWSNVGGVAGTAMTLNSTGLGVGVTPSAWGSNYKVVQVGQAGAVYGSAPTGFYGTKFNIYNDNTNDISITNNFVGEYRFNILNGSHIWFNKSTSSGGIGVNQTLTQAMTLDASGNLLVGKSVSLFSTVGVEASGTGFISATNSASTNATTNLSVYSTGAAAFRFYVGLGGTVFATNTTISAISDARLKENVQDIDVGLGAILALKPRKFDWKAGKGKDIKGDRGFIAQEFEQVFPNLIDEWKDPAPESEAPYKSVRQDLIPVLVKAIQELAARVQTLETR